jgi:hypothetical protein
MHVIAGDARCMILACGKVRKYDPCAKGMHRRKTLIDHLLYRNSIPHAMTGNRKDRNGESVSPASSVRTLLSTIHLDGLSYTPIPSPRPDGLLTVLLSTDLTI